MKSWLEGYCEIIIGLTLFFFFFGHMACGILVPRPGIETRPPEAEARSPNHWTTREFPHWSYSDFL